MRRILFILITAAGALEALLLARFVLRLFAARPANPVFAAFFALTMPVQNIFASLDAEQPHFGAVLEISTLAACGLLLVLLCALVLCQRFIANGYPAKLSEK